MKQIDQFISISEAKNRLLQLLRELGERDEVLAITRDGVPAAVALSPDRYGGLLETIEILSDSQAMRSLHRSLKQAQKSRWVSDEAVFGKQKA